MSAKEKHIAVVGAGPAGLRAAEVAAEGGAKVTLYDAMRSAGRKFLIAGKSGLNLTSDEEFEDFLSRYQGNDLPIDLWRNLLENFDNTALRNWAGELGVQTFVSSAKKVFPVSMKAAPLLRRWVEKLRKLGVDFRMNHRWQGVKISDHGFSLEFLTEGKQVTREHDAVVLALGGGSWRRSGSDGEWVKPLTDQGVEVTPLTAANCGWEIAWSDFLLDKAEGLPLKNIVLYAGDANGVSHHGELVITKYGIEGAPIYRLGYVLKQMDEPTVYLDMKPSFTERQLIDKMQGVKKQFLTEAKKRWKLSPAMMAILRDPDLFPRWESVEALANVVKRCPLKLTQPRPIDEAISSAGGVQWCELDENLMLKKLPHVYCVGEMIDWEAPTGGFLLQGCFATGTHVGRMLSK